ncbi:MAG: ThiF family adenylyltransferase [Tepidisphaeraceae bacterium]|jgi:molybdopterin/thiamine biosynthesis adenylyltransferase
MSETGEHPAAPKSVAVIGVGNIGSQLVTHLARLPAVKRLVIVDDDSVRAENTSQEYSSRDMDVGQKKAIASARRARRIRRHDPLQVEPIVARVENVPWGRTRVSVFIACVDSLLSRLSINEIAWRLGTPWIDTGIRADGSLARLQVHVPAMDAPCIQCSWGAMDRDSLSRAYSCDGRLKESAPTGASSALGGLAASLAAIECQKLFDGSFDQSLAGRQLIVEARYHHYYVNTLRRNSACPFDHQVWSIQKLPQTVRTLGDLVEHGRKLFRGAELPASVSAERMWVTRLVCPLCGQQARTLRLQGRIGAKLRLCSQCGGEMQPMGFYLLPRLDVRSAGDRLLARPLRRFGLRAGDVLTLNGSHESQHVELSLANEPGGN